MTKQIVFNACAMKKTKSNKSRERQKNSSVTEGKSTEINGEKFLKIMHELKLQLNTTQAFCRD